MSRRLLIVSVSVITIALVSTAYVANSNNLSNSTLSLANFANRQSPSSTSTDSTQNKDSSPSNQPFQELTIPYLRTLDFTSQLAPLEPYQSQPTYDSFLTGYQSDGLKVNALLTLPKGEPPATGWPGVIFIHGYIPPASYQTTERYDAYVDYLARNGLAVLKIDLRGHGDSEGEANGAYYSSDYIRDTLFAYSALGNHELVDADKIGLWGHSMAGNVVLRTLAVKPDIPAAVIWAGAVYTYEDWQKYGLSDHSFRLTDLQRSDRANRRQALFDTHGEFDATSSFWQTVVPANYLSDIKTALQLHHAVDDNVVNVAYSRDLVQLLESVNVDHEFFEYPSGGHNITGSSFNQAMARTVEWFREKL